MMTVARLQIKKNINIVLRFFYAYFSGAKTLYQYLLSYTGNTRMYLISETPFILLGFTSYYCHVETVRCKAQKDNIRISFLYLFASLIRL